MRVTRASQRNVVTRLRCGCAGNPMQSYDRLPKTLRAWLRQARLPWSPRSVARLWRKAQSRLGNDTAALCATLDQAEDRLIAKDAARVWGPEHPAATAGG